MSVYLLMLSLAEQLKTLYSTRSLGVAALILGFVLKVVDKKKGIGLELPNITPAP